MGEIDGLFDQVIAVRKEIQELTVAEPENAEYARAGLRVGLSSGNRVQVAAAERAVAAAEQQRAGTWQEIRAELEGETIEAVDNGMRRGAAEKRRLDGSLESARARLGRLEEEAAEREREPPAAIESAPEVRQSQDPVSPPDPEPVTEAVEPEPEPEPEAVEPTPEEIREAAAAAVEGLVPLYDELIGLLEAIEEVQSDAEEKRRARSRVTVAEVAKRQEMESRRQDVAAEQMFRVTGAHRQVGRTSARLEREIAEARELLRRLSGGDL